jgi:hypothetical protein
MAIKTLRVFQEFTSEGFVPMPPQGNIDYGFTIAGTFPGTTPATYQLDDPDIDVEVTVMTDFYVWIRSHGSEWNINYTRNVRVYPDSPLINNVVMGIIIANALNGLPTGGTAGQILSKIDADDYNAEWIDNVADWTSQLKHQVKAGVALTKGQAVYVSGADGTNIVVSKASNVNESLSSKTMGLIAQNLNNNAKGFVIAEGLLTGLNTSSANAGDPVWLGVDGALIYGLANKPYAPAHLVFIGIVTRSNNNNGEIFVKVQNGFELKEIHDVQILNPLNKNIIVYDSVTQLWKNRNIFGTQGYLPYYDNTSLMLNSPFWTNGSLVGLGTITPTALLHMKGTTAYTNVILDNNGPTGGGMFSAYQNGAETAMFGADAYYQASTSIDAAIASKKAGSGIQFYTNGSQSEKMGINSDGNVFVGQTPTYVAGATQLIVRGKTGAGFLGVNHYDMSIKGFMNTFNSVFQVGTSTFHSLAFLVENSERGRVNSSGRLLWGTTTDNGVDLVQINGSLIASSIKKSGGTSSQYLMADGSVSTGSSLTASAPLSITSGVISISQSSASVNGFLSSTDWSTFNSKQSALSGTGFVKVSGSTISYDNTVYTPASRLLSINGTSYDLTADRAWTITPGSGMRNISSFVATGGQTTFTIVGGYTAGLVDVFVNGARLNYADYTATNGTTVVLAIGVVANDIVDIINYVASLTSGLTGAGTTNYIPKWSGSSNLTNSLIFDNGTNVGIGTASPTNKLHIRGGNNNTLFVDNDGSQLTSILYANNGTARSYTLWNNTSSVMEIGTLGLHALVLSTSSNERLRITSDGLIGIGTSSPTRSLQINRTSTAFINVEGSVMAFGSSDAPLLFFANNNESIRILSSGNVGIGTTTPTNPSNNYRYLHIQGGNGSVGGAVLYLSTLNETHSSQIYADSSGLNINTNTSLPIMFSPAGAERMRITPSGNVGIGTNSPSNFSNQTSLTINGSNVGRLDLQRSGSTIGTFYVFSNTAALSAPAGGGMEFQTSIGTVATITNSGNLGIGMSNPSNLLTLGVSTGDAVGSNTTLAITCNNQYGITAARKFLNINFVGFGAEIKAQIQSWDESGNTGNGTLAFNTRIGGVLGERMRIALDGTVAIGSTTRANVWGLLTLRNTLNATSAMWGIGPDTNNSLTVYNPSNVGVFIASGATSWTANSDINLKDIQGYIENAIESIMELKAIKFNWKSDLTKNTNIGLIAQEVQKVYPELIDKNSDGYLGVRYTELIPVLVQAIKELNAKIEAK